MREKTRYKQFDDLLIDDFEVDEWPHPLHNHNHFELVFIDKGTGMHFLNGSYLKYRKGDLYLLGPEDLHEFMVEERSRFLYFKFTKLYLSHEADAPVPGNWNKDMDVLLYSPFRKKGNLLNNDKDRVLVAQLMHMIIKEYVENRMLHRKIIYQLFSVIILILKRNRSGWKPRARTSHRKKSGIAEDLIEYVEFNIYEPHKLTLNALAEHFHYSSNYVGMLFKDKVGSSLREYVSGFRLKLIEERLRDPHIGLKQIVSEFGLVDESHLHKFIKGKTGKTLMEVRKG